ncbi:MAG: amino acid ABC transporter substrate-binding protein [Pseudomonadota bacterium]
MFHAMRLSGLRLDRLARGAAILLVAAGLIWSSGARAAEPITIGFGMALTGGLAAIGKTALLAMQIWEADVNAKGGLMGRPVKLVFYDDQSNPGTVPGIYTKLMDVDKVDFVVSGYATNMVAPAIPVVMAQNKLFMGLFGLAANSQFHYPKYFSMLPTGEEPKVAFSKGFFNIAATLEPKPKTIAIVAADAEFSKNASDGARENANAAGLKILYDRSYPPPPATTDYAPIVRAIQATNADLVYIASYPPDSVGLVRAINEVGLKGQLIGGGMVGLQITAVKQQLNTQINGLMNFDWWTPVPTMMFPGTEDFLKKYQARAPGEGVDPLGYYLPPFAYAYLQILGDAITGAKTLDQDKVADYLRATTFKTIIGDISYGKDGEWKKPRVLMTQFQGIKGNDVEQFKSPATEVVLDPPEYKSGQIVYPYAAKK